MQSSADDRYWHVTICNYNYSAIFPSFCFATNRGKGFHCRGLSWCWALTPEQLGLASPVADNTPCEGCIVARSRWWRFFAHDLGRRKVRRFMWGSAMFKSHSHSFIFILIYVLFENSLDPRWRHTHDISGRNKMLSIYCIFLFFLELLKLAWALKSSSYTSRYSKMNLYKYLCSFDNHVDLDHLDTSHLHLPVFDFRRRVLKQYTYW